MFLLSSARDNAVFGRYRGSKAVPLSRTYPRRLVGKIPMPTFDPGKSFCCACGEPVDSGSETDVCRMERIPPLTGWITPIAGTFVHIVHKRLWEMFPKNRTNGFVVGKAFDANGVPMDDWVSLSGRNAIVRNATPAYYGICAGCGSFFYDGIGAPYVCFPDDGKHMFKTATGFLFSSSFADCFDFGELNRHHVRVETVKCIAEPKDGLPPVVPYRHARPAVELADWLSSLVCNADMRQPEDAYFDDLAGLCDKIRAVRLDPVRLLETCIAGTEGVVKNRLSAFLSLPPDRQSLRAHWWIPGHVYPEDMDNSEYAEPL